MEPCSQRREETEATMIAKAAAIKNFIFKIMASIIFQINKYDF